jgi:uncharacterized protein YqjF (DUF2071 family)
MTNWNVVSGGSRPRPWLMAQSWHDLLFAHWPVALDQLRRVVPQPLEIDTFDDHAWLGVVAFRLSGIHLRGLPAAPGLAGFPEVNLRTYVSLDHQPGVLFLSLHCPNRLAMAVARPWFRLPYHYAAIQLARSDSRLHFDSRSPAGADFAATYCPSSPPCTAPSGSLDAWLTERYCYYTASPDGSVYRCDIQHRPWWLSKAQACISSNTLTQPFGLPPSEVLPLLHFAKRMDAVIWPLQRASRPHATKDLAHYPVIQSAAKVPALTSHPERSEGSHLRTSHPQRGECSPPLTPLGNPKSSESD